MNIIKESKMNPKDRAFLMKALIECHASNERKSKFVLDKDNNDRLVDIGIKLSKEEIDKELTALKRGLGYGNTLQG